MKLNPKKLLRTKWTAIAPQNKEKHFMVTKLIAPEDEHAAIELVEIEAVHSKRTEIIAWRNLTDESVWLQGWF